MGLMALSACAPLTVENPFTPPPPIVVQLGEPSPSAPIAIRRNQTLYVTLDADTATGLRWEVQPGFTPTLRQIGSIDYISPASGPSNPPGVMGTMTFRFRAAQLGTTTLEFAYRRPFEPGTAPAKTVRYDVTVG